MKYFLCSLCLFVSLFSLNKAFASDCGNSNPYEVCNVKLGETVYISNSAHIVYHDIKVGSNGIPIPLACYFDVTSADPDAKAMIFSEMGKRKGATQSFLLEKREGSLVMKNPDDYLPHGCISFDNNVPLLADTDVTIDVHGLTALNPNSQTGILCDHL